MTTRLNPYLAFNGNAREAMELYASVFGGHLTVMTYADQGGMGLPEDQQHLVMHSEFVVDETLTLMGADQPDGSPAVNGTISLSGDEDDVLRRWWAALAEGGSVTIPLEVAPWGDAFGQLKDRFGVDWMFNLGGAPGA